MAYPSCPLPLPRFADTVRAQTLLQGITTVTPLEASKSFSSLAGRELQLKPQTPQSTGS